VYESRRTCTRVDERDLRRLESSRVNERVRVRVAVSRDDERATQLQETRAYDKTETIREVVKIRVIYKPSHET